MQEISLKLAGMQLQVSNRRSDIWQSFPLIAQLYRMLTGNYFPSAIHWCALPKSGQSCLQNVITKHCSRRCNHFLDLHLVLSLILQLLKFCSTTPIRWNEMKWLRQMLIGLLQAVSKCWKLRWAMRQRMRLDRVQHLHILRALTCFRTPTSDIDVFFWFAMCRKRQETL